MNKSLRIEVPAELHKSMRMKAVEKESSVTELVRELLQAWVDGKITVVGGDSPKQVPVESPKPKAEVKPKKPLTEQQQAEAEVLQALGGAQYKGYTKPGFNLNE